MAKRSIVKSVEMEIRVLTDEFDLAENCHSDLYSTIIVFATPAGVVFPSIRLDRKLIWVDRFVVMRIKWSFF